MCFENSCFRTAAIYFPVEEPPAAKSRIYWAVKNAEVWGIRIFPRPWTLHSQKWAQNNPVQEMKLTLVHCWEQHLLILHMSLDSAVKTAFRTLAQCCHPPRKDHFLVTVFFWHGCTNKLRFIQVRAAGSRCYCCNFAACQTAPSLYRPFPPERLCNEGVIGLITLCLPIMVLRWSGLFPNTLWQAWKGGGASFVKDTSLNQY